MSRGPLERSLQGYERLFRLENALRELIIEELSASCGRKWWKQRVPNDMHTASKAGKQYESSQPWQSRIVYHPIYYVDFPSLRSVIERTDNWNEVFSSIFGRKDLVLGALAAVEPARNRIAHSRHCLAEDISSLDRALSMLETAVGVARLEQLVGRTTSLVDGATAIEGYCSSLVHASGKIDARMHLLDDELIEPPPGWLLDEVFGDLSDDLVELDGLIHDYARIPIGRGSALRLRAWAERERVTELVDRLELISRCGDPKGNE